MMDELRRDVPDVVKALVHVLPHMAGPKHAQVQAGRCMKEEGLSDGRRNGCSWTVSRDSHVTTVLRKGRHSLPLVHCCLRSPLWPDCVVWAPLHFRFHSDAPHSCPWPCRLHDSPSRYSLHPHPMSLSASTMPGCPRPLFPWCSTIFTHLHGILTPAPSIQALSHSERAHFPSLHSRALLH